MRGGHSKFGLANFELKASQDSALRDSSFQKTEKGFRVERSNNFGIQEISLREERPVSGEIHCQELLKAAFLLEIGILDADESIYEVVKKYLKNKQVFEIIINPTDSPALKNLVEKLYLELNGSLTPLLEEYSDLFRDFIASKYKTIDEIQADRSLAKALGTSATKGDIIGELLSRKLINYSFPGLDEFFKIQKISELRGQIKTIKGDREKMPNPFSGFGKCFENYALILFALLNQNIEYQVKLPSQTGKAQFRVADLVKFNFSDGSLAEIIEIKSGVHMGLSDKFQLKDFLSLQVPLTYLLYSKDNPIFQQLSTHSEVNILTIDELATQANFQNNPLHPLFSKKENFMEFKKYEDKNLLERRMFAIYKALETSLLYQDDLEELLVQAQSTDSESFEDYMNDLGFDMSSFRYDLLQASYFNKDSGSRESALDEKIRRLEKRLLRFQNRRKK